MSAGGRYIRSFALQMLILVSMVSVVILNEDLYVALVATTLMLLPPINWIVAGVLIHTSRRDPTVRSLADAAENALTLAINSTAAALMALVVLARITGLMPNQVGPLITVLIGFVVVSGSLPAIRFLQTWRDIWIPMIERGERGEHD